MTWVLVTSRVMLVAAFLGGLSFVAIYWLSSRWWRSDIGRNMMAFAISETVFLGVSVAVWLFGNFPGRLWFGLVAFAMFTGASWWRTAVLVRLLMRRRREDAAQQDRNLRTDVLIRQAQEGHMKNWLKRDALNRAWRAILQTLGAVVVIPAGTAGLQYVQMAMAGAATGDGFDWSAVGHSALWSAGVGAVISVLAYLHRMKLDPSWIPSAEPPTPPRADGGQNYTTGPR